MGRVFLVDFYLGSKNISLVRSVIIWSKFHGGGGGGLR